MSTRRSFSCLIQLACFVSCLTAIAGCSRGSIERPLTPSERELLAKPLAVDVFSARGFLGGSDYERYALSGDVLWRECGNLDKKSAPAPRTAVDGDHALPNEPGLNLVERRLETLSTSQALELRKSADAFVADEKSKGAEPPRPGSVFALSGPGVFELRVKLGERQRRIVTSIDAVADQDENELRSAQSLFSVLRAVGPVICNAPTFYGIGRKVTNDHVS